MSERGDPACCVIRRSGERIVPNIYFSFESFCDPLELELGSTACNSAAVPNAPNGL